MKKVIVLVILCACILAVEQTTIPLSSIRALGNGAVLVLVDNSLRVARLDGLTVDTTVEPILRVTAPPVTTAEWKRVDYVVAGVTAELVIPDTYTTLLVFRNGLLMSIGNDYTVSGSRVVFVSSQVPGTGDIVILRYQ